MTKHGKVVLDGTSYL